MKIALGIFLVVVLLLAIAVLGFMAKVFIASFIFGLHVLFFSGIMLLIIVGLIVLAVKTLFGHKGDRNGT